MLYPHLPISFQRLNLEVNIKLSFFLILGISDQKEISLLSKSK